MEAQKLSPIGSYINDFDRFTSGRNFWQASLIIQVEGLTLEQALYRPAPDRHCIWQIVRHIAYWKYWAITYLKDGLKLDAKESNWAPMPEVQNETSWQEDLNKLLSLNDQCRRLAESIGDELLCSTEEKIVFFRQLLLHDCYHTGQIGFLRAMQGIKPVE